MKEHKLHHADFRNDLQYNLFFFSNGFKNLFKPSVQLPDKKNVNTEPYKLTAGMSQACSSATAISDGCLVADWQINMVNIVQY